MRRLVVLVVVAIDCDHCLIVVASSLAGGIEETGPVLGFEISLEVTVDEGLNVGSPGADGEHSQVAGGLELTEHKGTEYRGERAPVTDELTGLEGEGGLMEWAHQGTVADVTLVQGGTQVWAYIGHSVDAAIEVGHKEELEAISLHGDQVTGSNIGGLQQRHPFLLYCS